MSEEIKTGEKTGFRVEEYKGNYSLIAMNNGYATWAKFKKNKNEYQEKDWPVKIVLGEKGIAEVSLLSALFEITGKTYVESHGNTAQSYGAGEQSAPLDDSIPF